MDGNGNKAPGWIKRGMRVRYHPIIGGPHDGKVYVVRGLPELLGGHTWVCRLDPRRGCVACSSLSPEEDDPA